MKTGFRLSFIRAPLLVFISSAIFYSQAFAQSNPSSATSENQVGKRCVNGAQYAVTGAYKKTYDLCEKSLADHPHWKMEEHEGVLASVTLGELRCRQGQLEGITDTVTSTASLGGTALEAIAFLQQVENPFYMSEQAYQLLKKANEHSPEAKEFIHAIAKENPNPISGSYLAAASNTVLYKEAADQAKQLATQSAQAMTIVKEQMTLHFKEFECLPYSVQQRIVCKLAARIESEALLLFLTPAEALKGLKWSLDLAKVAGEFLDTAKAAEEFKNLAFIDKVNHTGELIAEEDKIRKTTSVKWSSDTARITSRKDELGVSLGFEVKIDGKWVARSLEENDVTGLINGRSKAAKALINHIITETTKEGKQVTVAFVDLNDLGKVNYVGLHAGDTYLKSMGQAVMTHLRAGDIAFHYGGDEVLLILQETTPEGAQHAMQRISDSILKNPVTNEMFRSEHTLAMEQLEKLKTVTHIGEMEEDIAKMPVHIRQAAADDFDAFKEAYAVDRRRAAAVLEKLKPSASMGASVVKPGDTIEMVEQRARAIADRAKLEYKAALGQDTSKYGTSMKSGQVNQAAEPKVYPPQ